MSKIINVKIASLLLIAVTALTVQTVNANLVQSLNTIGPANTIMHTDIDSSLRVVKYKFYDLDTIFGQSPKEISFNINTGIAENLFESDPAYLTSLPVTSSYFLSTTPIGIYVGTPEAGLKDKKGYIVIEGIDGTYRKKAYYEFGFVYSDLLVFNGIFKESMIQINSEDYLIYTPELVDKNTLPPIPLPKAFPLLLTALIGIVALGRRESKKLIA